MSWVNLGLFGLFDKIQTSKLNSLNQGWDEFDGEFKRL